MQTFLPYPNFEESAKVIDNKRLWKQILEAKQIRDVLNGKSNGWTNHPAVRMWKGWDTALDFYIKSFVNEWLLRRVGITLNHYKTLSRHSEEWPTWLGDERLHSSHRSNLLRKNSEHYKKFNWTENNNLPYYWPVI